MRTKLLKINKIILLTKKNGIIDNKYILKECIETNALATQKTAIENHKSVKIKKKTNKQK